MSELHTSQRIVDAATGLIKVRGYNAFSYQDISGLVGIRKASVHHHFSTKADLGKAVVHRFTETFSATLEEIEVSRPTGLERIVGFAEAAGDLVDKKERCPCAMLASEAETLPVTVNEASPAYYGMVADWLCGCVQLGREDGSVGLPGEPDDIAQLVLATIQGAAMTARCMKTRAEFDATMRQLRRALAGPQSAS